VPPQPSGAPAPGRTARPRGGPRFYLFALKGYAYLSLRLGEAEEGAAVLALLEQLDPTDSLGHRVLGAVLARAGRDVDYDEPVETAP
jgi:Flp pilus assembly protein TadD